MATKTTNKDGSFRVRFTNYNGQRLELRFKKGQSELAETARRNIEQLIQHKISKTAFTNTLATWVSEIPSALHDKLHRYELVGKRAEVENAGISFVDYVQKYIDDRKDTSSKNTIRNHTQCMTRIRKHFGDTPLADVTIPAAKKFRDKLISQLAPATVSREIRRAKQYCAEAVHEKIINTNPFDGIYSRNEDNDQRMYFVDNAKISQIMAHCPDAEWRLIIAFARYGGLRIPSEINNLKWSDINWSESRMSVPSPKNEKKRGSAYRIVPIFKELKPYLEQAFEQAQTGSEYCIGRYREPNQNLRTQFGRILRRAGVQQWPKLFVNLRSSRETELNNEFPQHVVCKWLDNTPDVAKKHYLQITDSHFGAAVGHEPAQAESGDAEKFPQFFTQHVGELGCTPMQGESADAVSAVDTAIYDVGESIQYPQGDANTCSVAGATATFQKTSPNNSPTANICRVNIQPKKQSTESDRLAKIQQLANALLAISTADIDDDTRAALGRELTRRILDST